ncbi:MAG: T9SS type A sorting domain-containing protein [Crocinitomicaceae bacterium]|nr:T9SS type A sorting domain-containing protein [Crocinitomicaceae bacterium]
MKSYYLAICCLLSFSFLGFAQNLNLTNSAVFDGEPYLAIDPNDNQHLVAAWMGFKLGEGVIIKSKYSDDGGSTWSNVNEIPHITGAESAADVSLEYDSNGNLFMCYVDYDNLNFSQGDVLIRKSTDGGATWGNPVSAISVLDCPNQLCVDRPWIAIDNSTGPNNGAIFVTTINADQPTLVIPPYHAYLVVSTDEGATFSTPRFLDSTNYNVGQISQAGNSPLVAPNGTFYANYPSYDTSQSPFAHIYMSYSSSLGVDIDHNNAYTVLIQGVQDPFAKKGGSMFCDPSEPNHLAMLLLGQENGDPDIYFLETYDAVNWSTPIRINDDPVANGKMQDLVWGAFNENGDVAICWRDRRNGSANGYQTETEIYGVIRYKDSTDFEPNFPISSQQAPHDVVLEGAGNDFMNVQFVGDTVYSIWGDVRTGTVNIFLNKYSVSSGTSSVQTIHSSGKAMAIYPNPTNESFTIDQFEEYENCQLIDASGKVLKDIKNANVQTADLPSGNYFVRFLINNKALTAPVIIQH